jgi:hypothetical protein
MEESRSKSYFRTLIFTVVASILSMALFGVLFVKRELMTFVILVEIGIFAIIGYCIYSIVNHEKLLSKMNNPNNYNLRFDSCPDYFIKRYDDVSNKEFCSNEYVVVDKKSPLSKKVLMKIVEENGTLPAKHTPTYMMKDKSTGIQIAPKPSDKFMIDTMMAPELLTNKDRCDVIRTNVAPRADGKFDGFKGVPWTYTRTRCDGLYAKY